MITDSTTSLEGISEAGGPGFSPIHELWKWDMLFASRVCSSARQNGVDVSDLPLSINLSLNITLQQLISPIKAHLRTTRKGR